MSCSFEFIDYLLEILYPLGKVYSRKMMGEYVIYLNEKCVVLACDNNAYVKKLPCIQELMKDAETGNPYPGAKEWYILDLSSPNHVRKVIPVLWNDLPFPVKKSKKQKKR